VFDIKKMNEERGQEEWFCPLFMRPGDITLFGGESKKSGKTTFYAHMLKCVHDGKPFMGMPTIKSGALVLTEQGTNILEATHKAGIEDDDIYFALYKDLSKEAWPKVMQDAVATCSNLGVNILVVDTFTAFAKLRHSDENLSGEIIERMEPVLEAARVHGLHVSILHHTGKDGELRGSSAFGKDPDAIWILKRPSGDHGPNVRALEGTGRYDDINSSFNVELGDDGYVLLGTNSQIERAKAENKLLEIIPFGKENAVRRKRVLEVVDAAVKVSKATVQRALERLIEKHVVLEEKLQEKGSPLVLWRPAFKSGPQTPNDSPEPSQLEETPANKPKTEGGHLFKSDTKRIGGENDSNKDKPKKKKHYTLLDWARAHRELHSSQFPNLIHREKQASEILGWLDSEATTGVGVDIETYGVAKLKGERSKLALSFVHGQIRLLQLSDGETTYIIDAALLRPATISTILEALRGKTLITHSGIFDLPRLKRHYGVDLDSEDLVDTMVLSRLARSGELKDDGKPVEHGLGAVLKTEGVARISKDIDHGWHEPLNEKRLNYATDDVRYLPALRDALMDVVKERNQLLGLDLFMPTYRE
jgi:hypothetical protein